MQEELRYDEQRRYPSVGRLADHEHVACRHELAEVDHHRRDERRLAFAEDRRKGVDAHLPVALDGLEVVDGHGAGARDGVERGHDERRRDGLKREVASIGDFARHPRNDEIRNRDDDIARPEPFFELDGVGAVEVRVDDADDDVERDERMHQPADDDRQHRPERDEHRGATERNRAAGNRAVGFVDLVEVAVEVVVEHLAGAGSERPGE